MKRINILTLIIFLICNIFVLPIDVVANTDSVDVAITEYNTEKEFIDTTIAFIQNRRGTSYKGILSYASVIEDGNAKARELLNQVKDGLGEYAYYNLYGTINLTIEHEIIENKSHIAYSFSWSYRLTNEEEEYFNRELKKVLGSLNLNGKSEYEKVKAIYEYVVKNVYYVEKERNEIADRKLYTAYGALINHKAVCQGYSLLLYRMFNEVGIDSFIVHGGEVVAGKEVQDTHTWNVIKLGNSYYHMDATWDEMNAKYNDKLEYFLLGEKHFSKTHVLYGPKNIAISPYDYVHTIRINTKDSFIEKGSSKQMDIQFEPNREREYVGLSFTSSNPQIASVDTSGVIYTYQEGVTQIGIKNTSGYEERIEITVVDTQKEIIEEFVTRLYQLCLNRNPDPNGKAYWVNNLLSKKTTAAGAAKGFFESNEMKKLNLSNEEFVKRCYRVMMNREADKGGLAYWVDRLAVGMSRLSVVKGFVGSTEFTKICNSYGIDKGDITLSENRDLNYGVTAFVSRCYTKVLGRGFDVGGLNYWTGKIMESANKKEGAANAASSGFFNSNEFVNKRLSNADFIKVCYRTFLDREADANGLNYWLTQMPKGKDVVLRGFANSNEFNAIMAKYGIR
ncbi:MAG: DUF4214 domain-containing protein [Solobacterium sp.]|nr:DUF4214 domain-containing protein [Solobacterium sp.]